MSDQEKTNSTPSDETAQEIEEQKDETTTDECVEDLSDNPQAELKALQLKHIEVSDAYLRAKAEVENIRRRSAEEEAKARRFAVEGFAKALLPIIDSLEAALNTPDQTVEIITEGVDTTLKQLISAFESNKLQAIAPAVGDKLDPHLHQAIAVVPSEEHEPNSIIEVLQKGYTLSDRVLRPAMVIVASAA